MCSLGEPGQRASILLANDMLLLDSRTSFSASVKVLNFSKLDREKKFSHQFLEFTRLLIVLLNSSTLAA